MARDLDRKLRKYQDDVDQEIFIEIPEIVMIKAKNLPQRMPRLDQLARFWNDNRSAVNLVNLVIHRKSKGLNVNMFGMASLIYQHALTFNWMFQTSLQN